MSPATHLRSGREGRGPGQRLAASVALAACTGLVVGLVMPRGPVTTAQAVALIPAGLAVGAAAGLLMRSRWAMLAAPLAYMAAFELAWMPSEGLTVDGIHLGSTWGILAVIVGRGFHGLLVLLPMLLGAALAAGWVRRQGGAPPRRRSSLGKVALGLRRGVAGAVALGLILLVVALLRPASTPPIVDAAGRPVPGSVAELTKVQIGGVDQWLQIRGSDPNDPVVLYLPGGPGQSDLGFSRALLAELTDDFVVVTWDGRGIGKAYPSFDPEQSAPDRTVADTIEVTDYLRRRFDEDKIFLFGESGGSVTGVQAVQQHPERYRAWVGSGQMVDPRETDRRLYRDLLAHFAEIGDAGAADTLRSFGEPPYDSVLAYAFVMGHYDALAGDYDPPAEYERRAKESGVGFMGLGASEYTLVDKVGAVRGLMDTFGSAYPQWQDIDFRESVRRLTVPVHVFTGDHELAARSDLTDAWFRQLAAPAKYWHSFPNAGHATAFEHADQLHRALLAEVNGVSTPEQIDPDRVTEGGHP